MGFHTKPTTFVGHVKIKVENLERSLTFYQDTLGFDILERTQFNCNTDNRWENKYFIP